MIEHNVQSFEVPQIMIEQYLAYLTEGKERADVQRYRESHGEMWMFHGTPSDKSLDSIKREGLKTQKVGTHFGVDNRIETELGLKKGLWLTPKGKIAEQYAHLTQGFYSKKTRTGEVVLAKVKTKFLHPMTNFWLLGLEEYVYEKDIPVKNILFEKDSNFDKVIKQHSYLKKHIKKYIS